MPEEIKRTNEAAIWPPVANLWNVKLKELKVGESGRVTKQGDCVFRDLFYLLTQKQLFALRVEPDKQ